MGFEAELGGQITDKLGVNANYAYTETKTLEAEAKAQGLPLNNTPRNQRPLQNPPKSPKFPSRHLWDFS